MRLIQGYPALYENVQAAKALLKRLNVPQSRMAGFDQIRRMVGGSLGYVNFLTKLHYAEGLDMTIFEEIVSRLRRLTIGGQNESAGHVVTTFGSFLAIRG